MALCKVTGALYLPDGSVARDYAVFLKRTDKRVTADYLGSVVPQMVRVLTSATGAVDFDILTGSYRGVARPISAIGGSVGYEFDFAVPDSPTAAFESCIDAIAPAQPTPTWLQRVEQAVADAEAAAADAEAVADGLEGAVEGLEGAVEVVDALSRGDALDDGGGIVLIGYQNDRAALVQRDDGLDFVPSGELVDSITGQITSGVDASEGIPLIGFRNDRVSVMQKRDGIDFIPSSDLLERLGVGPEDLLSKTHVELISVNGQSHSIGGPWDAGMTYQRANTYANKGSLQLVGTFRSDGAEISNSMGPGTFGYNASIPATGLANAVPGTNQIGLPFPATVVLNDHRGDENLPQYASITGAHGIGGIPLSSMGPGSTVWDSFTFWTAQAASQAEAYGLKVKRGWHIFNHGGAGKTFPRGQYRDEWIALQKQTMEHFDSIGLPQPRYIMTLTGGEANTTNDTPGNWAVADDQLDLVEMGCAVAGTSDYWYPIYDSQVHWDASATAIAGETLSWAMAEVESGEKWSIVRPKILSNSSGVLKLHFHSLREDEQLYVESGIKYNGEGIDSYLGFELVGSGSVISGIDVSGNVVTINYSGTPTDIRYALQRQDVSTFPNNKYTAHRGLLRTTLTKPSKLMPGTDLVRPIPSFTIPLGA